MPGEGAKAPPPFQGGGWEGVFLDEVLVGIRQQSNQTQADLRIPELKGMIELIEHLTNADYRTPAILYGFLKSEIERLGS